MRISDWSSDVCSSDLIERVENHRYEPLQAARWRNPELDFSSIDALIATLDAPPPREGLIRGREADDSLSLQVLRQEAAVLARAPNAGRVKRLWQEIESASCGGRVGEYVEIS